LNCFRGGLQKSKSWNSLFEFFRPRFEFLEGRAAVEPRKAAQEFTHSANSAKSKPHSGFGKAKAEGRRLSPAQGEPKRGAFWFSEFGALPQTPPRPPRSLRATPAKSKPQSGFGKAKAEGFRPRKG
jgi:hypothetical protein